MFDNLLPWIAFNSFIFLMLIVDLVCFHKKAKEVSFKEAFWWSVFWIGMALLFNLYIYETRGKEDALNFFSGYLIEKLLSIDNLFVFLLIFKYFQTPASSLRKVLFWGVFGAILMRALFIFLGIELITHFHSVIYIFGAFLIFTGIKLFKEKEKKLDLEKNWIIKIFHRFFRVTKEYEEDRFFIQKNSTTFATPLCLVLIAVETTDLIFAVDSIPAIFAITKDPFIVYTSNIFAILGLRSLYFLLSHVMTLFHYLHYALSFILIFIGFKMLSSDFFEIPTAVTLGTVVALLLISIVASLLNPVKGKPL